MSDTKKHAESIDRAGRWKIRIAPSDRCRLGQLGFIHDGTATIELSFGPCRDDPGGGQLYVNGLSIVMLKDMRADTDEFLAAHGG